MTINNDDDRDDLNYEIANLNARYQVLRYDPVEGDPDGVSLAERLGNPEGIPGPTARREIERTEAEFLAILDYHDSFIH